MNEKSTKLKMILCCNKIKNKNFLKIKVSSRLHLLAFNKSLKMLGFLSLFSNDLINCFLLFSFSIFFFKFF